MNDPRLTDARRSSRSVSSGPGESPPPSVSGYGESDGKAVQVTIGEDGLTELVTIDPRAMRRGSEALAESVREAMRHAQADWIRRLTEAQAEWAQATKERFRERLDEISADYERRKQDWYRTVGHPPKRR